MSAQLKSVAPVFLVRDLKVSLAFWQEKLGFDPGPSFGDHPNFAMPRRDGVVIMLVQAPAGAELPPPNWKVAPATNQVYIWVDDAAALYAEVQERGAPIDFTLYDTPWGTREFGSQDPEGHDIAFGQVLESKRT